MTKKRWASAADGGSSAADVRTERAPVLFPAPCLRAWAAGLRWSIEVDVEGALVWRKTWAMARGAAAALAADEPVVLAPPGSVSDVWLAKRGSVVGGEKLRHNSVVFVVAGGVPVVAPVDAWTPWPVEGFVVREGNDALASGGFRAVVAALGCEDVLRVEVRDAAGDHLGETLNLDGSPPAALSHHTPKPLVLRRGLSSGRLIGDMLGSLSLAWHSVAALVVALLCQLCFATADMTATNTDSRMLWPAVAAAVVALALAGGVIAWGEAMFVRARRRHLAPIEGAADRVGGLPIPCQLATLADGSLVLVSPDGVQLRVPGPALGGVVEAAAHVQAGVGVRSIELRFAHVPHQGSRPVIAELTPRWWGPSADGVDRVRAWLDRAGISWVERPVPHAAPTESSRPGGPPDPALPWALARNCFVLSGSLLIGMAILIANGLWTRLVGFVCAAIVASWWALRIAYWCRRRGWKSKA